MNINSSISKLSLFLLIILKITFSTSHSNKNKINLKNRFNKNLQCKNQIIINEYTLLNSIRGGNTTPSSTTPSNEILKATLSATTQLLSAIVIGVIATKFDGVLDQNTIKVLSRLAYNIFQPAFLLCSVITTLSISSTIVSKKYLLVVSISSFLQVFLGSFCFKFLSGILSLFSKKGMEGVANEDVRFCTTFANAGTLPFIITNALFKSNQVLLSQVTSCLSFFLLGWSPMFWSYGRTILIGSNNNSDFSMVQTITKTIFHSPPILGSFLGLVIGSIPILRNIFVSSPIFTSLQMLGYGYLPSAILVLAGSLASSNKDDSSSNEPPSNQKTIINFIQPIFIILFTRFILSPIASHYILKLYQTFNILPTNTNVHSIISFVILLQSCMPPSQNSVIVLQMHNLSDRARNMANVLTVTYIASIVPIMILLGYCMKISNILSLL